MLGRVILVLALMSSFLVFSEDIQPKKKSFFKRIFDSAKSIVSFKDKPTQEKSTIDTKKEEIVDPAAKMPDPLFYDVIYPQTYNEKVPVWLYNDNSPYNRHIPHILYGSYIIDDLFKMLPHANNTPNLILILKAIQARDDVDFNKQDKFGNTLLHYAIRYGNKPIFNQLLATKKVSPNICNYSYICPIHLSIYKNDSKEIEELIKYGADLQYANDRFEMPIVTAIKIHNDNAIYTIAKHQKEKGISMNEIDYIIFIAKEEGLGDIAKNLYEFFMLGEPIDY